MGKTIWIINQYAQTPSTGKRGRHLYLARELVKSGHTVCIFGASFTHLFNDSPTIIGSEIIEDGVTVIRIPVSKYKSSFDKKRVFNWFLFAWRTAMKGREMPDKPDVVLASSPSLLVYLAAEYLARRHKSKLVFEVRDIWPLTLMQIGGWSKNNPFIGFLQYVEDRAYRRSDRVISNLPRAVDHMVERGMDPSKFSWIPNGYSSSDLKSNGETSVEILDQIPSGKFIVGYTGTHGVANALDTLIEAAEIVADDEHIAFVLVGQGQEKEKLQKMVSGKALRNFYFLDAVPKNDIPAVISKFDVCYIGLTSDPLFRFGVSPNKLFDYLIAGKPIIYAIDSGDYHPVGDINAGIEVEPENCKAVAEAIKKLRNMPKNKLLEMGENGQINAETHHEYEALARKFEATILDN